MFTSTYFLAVVLFTISLYAEANRIDIYQQTEYFEGDIQLPNRRNGIFASQKWTNGIIPYVPLGNEFSQEHKDMFRAAVKEIESQTCIRFVPRTTEADYITIIYGPGCNSPVGMYGGGWVSTVSLSKPGCWYHGTVVHELLHVIGLWHEQSRYDRDDYIIIRSENIKDGYDHAFELKFPNVTSTYGIPYNYLSVMHYPKDAFSKNGEPTIEVKDPAFEDRIGNREFGTNGDYEKVRRIYGCKGTYPTMPDPPVTPAPPLPPCKDNISYCDQIKDKCGKETYMEDHCRRTCGICTSDCKDEITYCRQYKKDCDKLAWMKTSCRKTCKFCYPF